MKKSRIVGYALTLAATLFVGSAMGQIKTNYVDITGADAGKTYITAGAKLGFYALPDPAFSTAYTALTNTNINKGTTWTWSAVTGTSLPLLATPYTSLPAKGDGTEETANYVEITAGATAKVVTVTYNENAPFAFLCPADAKTFNIHIFPAPSADLNNQASIVKNCGAYTLGAADLVLTVSATDKIDVLWSREVDELVVNTGTGLLEAKGAPAVTSMKFSNATTTLTPDLTDGITAWTYLNSTAYNEGNAVGPVAPSNGTHTLTAAGVLSVKGTHKVGTMYRYYFSGTDGVNDFVSRKSQFLTLGATDVKNPTKCTRYKAATTKEVVFYVINKPITGPVYHISNTIAN